MRKKAVDLRQQGMTYAEICRSVRVGIPKSTLTYWCKGVVWDKSQRDRIINLRMENLEKARTKALIVNKKIRNEYIDSIDKRVFNLKRFLEDRNILKLLLAMLYLGEGAKWKSHRGLQLGNSNPEIIKLYLSLLERCYGVSRNKLTAMIYHRADQNLKSLISFWSNITKIPISNFYRSNPDLRTKGKETRDGYYGVCAIFGPGTEIQLELEAIAKIFFKN